MPQFQITTQAPLIAFISIFLMLGGIVLLLFGLGIIRSGTGQDISFKIESGRQTSLIGLVGIILGGFGIFWSISTPESQLLALTPTVVVAEAKPASSVQQPEPTETPVISKLPSDTPTPKLTNTPLPPTSIPTPTIIVPGSILFEEDFEDGKAQKVAHISGNWQIVMDESGNKVYNIDNSNGFAFPSIDFGSTTWKDYAIEYRVKFLSDKSKWGILEFRRSEDGSHKYVVSLDATAVNLLYTLQGTDWRPITALEYNFKRGVWYSVRVEVRGVEIKVYIDDSLTINTEDSQISVGSLNMQVGPGTHVQFDDIRVIALGQ